MPNVQRVIQEEIKRLANKEIRKSVSDISSLKKRLSSMEKSIRKINADIEKIARQIDRSYGRGIISPSRVSESDSGSSRMGPRLILKLRKRLGLSRKDFSRLAGVSPTTLYLWEKGKSSPNKKAKAILVKMRSLTKKKAKKLLESPEDEGAKQGASES